MKAYDRLGKNFKDPNLVMGTVKRRLRRSKQGLQFH